MTALYIVCGVLLFLFLLTLCPVRLDVGFREEFSLTLRYLFLRFPLMPGKEGPTEEAPPQEKKEEKEGESAVEKLKAIVKRRGFFGFLESLFELVGMALSSAKKLVKKIKWKRFDLYLCVGGKEDAGAAAILYGQLSAAVYPVCAGLFGMTGCKRKAVTVDLDYGAPDNAVDFTARLSLRPIYVLKEGISLLIKGLPVLKGLLSSGKARKSQNKKPEGKVSVNE